MAEPTFWQTTWTKTKQIFRIVGASLPAILLILAVVVLALIGIKISIGGILAKLFGKVGDESKKTIEIANSIPKDRVDKNGKVIPQGVPDSTGQTQAVVVPIEKPGIFDDPSKIKVTPPGETKPIEIELPDGVKPADVEHVIIVTPEVVVVSVKDSSSVKGEDVDALLRKYGG
jgi:hypothetical protein